MLILVSFSSIATDYTEQDTLSNPAAEDLDAPPRTSGNLDVEHCYSDVNTHGHGAVNPDIEPSARTGTRASPESYIFYDDFETGTDGWTITDLDAGNGADYWASTTDRPCYGSSSLYCAGVGGTTGSHTIYYDTAEYAEQIDGWTVGDYNTADGEDYWGPSTVRYSPASPSNSYYCSAVGSVASITDWESGQNTTDVAIPDDGSWTYSAIVIDSAPAGAIVTSVDVHILVQHTYVSDLIVELNDFDLTYNYRLWDNYGTSTDGGFDDDIDDDWDIDLTVTGISDFNGELINQEWDLWVQDTWTGDTGYIDEWWIEIDYTNPDQHYDDFMDAYMKKEVDLTGQTGCSLSYHYWLDIEDGYDYAYVKMATTNYADPNDPGWTTVDTLSDNYDSGDYDDTWDGIWWSSGSLDISAFDGQRAYILFQIHSDGLQVREGWYIDNIEITGTGNEYDDYMDSYAEVTVDLTGYSNAYLACVFWMDAEDFYDTFRISVNRGAGWRDLLLLNDGADEYQYDAYDPDIYARIWWQTDHLDLTPECGYSNVQIRLWFTSDLSTTREGIYIDEFEIASVFFYDDMESGTNEWTSTHSTQPNWHQVSTDYYSFDTSWWCGSDGTGEYGNGMDEYLTHSFDLTYAEAATLQFLLTGRTEQDFDFLFIGISVDNGNSWDYYGGLTGDYSDGWYSVEIDLSGYTRHTALVTFDFYSDKTATDIGFWIDDVNIFGTVDLTPPSQVLNLRVTAPPQGRALDIQWDANVEFDISGYNIYRSLVSGSSYSLIATSSTNSYLDTGLTDGTTYYYVISAFDIAGNEGIQSAEDSGVPADTTPPAAVAEVYAEDLGIGGLVNISWLPGVEPDIAGYRIYYDTINFNLTTSATYYLGSPDDNQSATWCHVSGLTNDIQYYFGVTAIDKSSNENTSILKSAVVTPTDHTPPTVNIDTPGEGTTHSGQVRIIVYAADDCGIKCVYVSIDKGPPQPCIQTAFGWEYMWDSTTVADGTHTIDANATDNNGNIGYSTDISVEIDNTAPDPPSDLQITLSGNDIMLSWGPSPSPDFSHYTIYRDISPDISYSTPYNTTTGNSWTDIGAGDGDWQNYFYVVRAVDDVGNEDANEIKVGKFVKSLVEGWNLVSTPLILQDNSLTSVLQTVSWDYAQYYNASDTTDHWKTNSIYRPDVLDDLWTLNYTNALWMNVSVVGDHMITVGLVPTITSIQLETGWNFVGYSCFTDQTVEEALSGIPYEMVEAFDPVAPYGLNVMAGSDTMSCGNGYWIKVSSGCVWTISN